MFICHIVRCDASLLRSNIAKKVVEEEDDVARMRSAVQAVANGARQFMARLDPLNVPWLCALLMDQLLQYAGSSKLSR